MGNLRNLTELANTIVEFHTYCNWGYDLSDLILTAGGWWLGTGGFGSTGGTNSPGLPGSLGTLGSIVFSVSCDSLGLLTGTGGGVRGERFKVFSFSHPSGVGRTWARGRGPGGNEQDSLVHAGFLKRGGTGGSCSLGLRLGDGIFRWGSARHCSCGSGTCKGSSTLISGKLLLGGGGGTIGTEGLPVKEFALDSE